MKYLFDFKYNIYRNKRKTIMIKLRSDNSVGVYCPKRYPEKDALKFLSENSEKIKAAIESKKEKQKALFDSYTNSFSSLPLLGSGKNIVFNHGIKSAFSDDTFYLPANLSSAEYKTEIKKIYTKLASQYIKPLVKEIAEKYNLEYNSIKITSASSRWGSCTSRKNLNFSYKLMICDELCIEYVVCHELSHLLHLNHSKNFWESVEKMFPDHKAIRNKLKSYSEFSRIMN